MYQGVRVEAVEGTSGDGTSVQLADGSKLSSSRGVVVATEGPAASNVARKFIGGQPF